MFMYLCDKSTCLASDLELILLWHKLHLWNYWENELKCHVWIHDPLTDSAVFQWNAEYHTCKTH